MRPTRKQVKELRARADVAARPLPHQQARLLPILRRDRPVRFAAVAVEPFVVELLLDDLGLLGEFPWSAMGRDLISCKTDDPPAMFPAAQIVDLCDRWLEANPQVRDISVKLVADTSKAEKALRAARTALEKAVKFPIIAGSALATAKGAELDEIGARIGIHRRGSDQAFREQISEGLAQKIKDFNPGEAPSKPMTKVSAVDGVKAAGGLRMLEGDTVIEDDPLYPEPPLPDQYTIAEWSSGPVSFDLRPDLQNIEVQISQHIPDPDAYALAAGSPDDCNNCQGLGHIQWPTPRGAARIQCGRCGGTGRIKS